MAVRIVEEALRGNISGKVMAFAISACAIERKKQLCHANMPNVRIVLAFSRWLYDLYAEAGNP